MATKSAKKKQPNILVIFGDDTGYWNLSAYNLGVMGDRDEFLPTVHGFDEFFGNLYHLNAEEEPENVDYPKAPAFRQHFGPRGVLKSKADGKTGIGLYPDGMVEYDGHVGRLLDKLDQLGIADDTIVVYTTDNGAMTSMWPDGGMTPFRGEKDTNWEGAFRAPCVVRWPGVVKPGTQINELFSSEDWLPTLVAAAGEPDIVQKLLDGHDAGDKHFKVHLDGYEQTWMIDRAFVMVPAQAIVGRFLATFREFPSRQHPSSFSIDQVMATMENGATPVH
ncbi:hypothetical protein D7V80_34190 [Corallococcus sp. CA054B]|uniref:sulfatase-like hydrolase/transferase n=1 Tax=Corallococcus sp. CA054B TaxID=2316734 RepID=UPI000EA1B360|nr:sulfatase-like hydrolase/transferase [Corallococcus sp. CA054B]RKG61513.1 hypothetical protein D7V80_34190 [Corallococcus sp. CA054B]